MNEEIKVPKKIGRPKGSKTNPNPQPKIKGTRGGKRPGSGNKKGCKNAGLFKSGDEHPRVQVLLPLKHALEGIAISPAGIMPSVVTNADLLVARLWELAMTAAPSNPKGLNAIQEIFERLEGKTSPSKEELNSMEKSKSVTVVLPNISLIKDHDYEK